MNLKHLYYFWKIAKAGSIARAAESLDISPQTLSGQIAVLEEDLGTLLFSRKKRSLELTEAGSIALEYAEELFAISAELEDVLKHQTRTRTLEFRVGLSDAVPKDLAYTLLEPAQSAAEGVKLICREWRIDRLLTELSLHRLDLVIADKPIPPSVSVRAYNHRLVESGISFLGTPEMVKQNTLPFPECLAVLPLLLPGEDSDLRTNLNIWFERNRLHPKVIGEFDDCALLFTFGRKGQGIFPIPTVVEKSFCENGELVVLGRLPQVRATYYGISVERRISHPCVSAIAKSAQRFFEPAKS